MHFQYDTCLGLREGLRVFIFFLRFESFRLFAICERIDLYPIYEIIQFFFFLFWQDKYFSLTHISATPIRRQRRLQTRVDLNI